MTQKKKVGVWGYSLMTEGLRALISQIEELVCAWVTAGDPLGLDAQEPVDILIIDSSLVSKSLLVFDTLLRQGRNSLAGMVLCEQSLTPEMQCFLAMAGIKNICRMPKTDADMEYLVAGLRAMAEGNPLIDITACDMILPDEMFRKSLPTLREIEIMILLAEGKLRREIPCLLGISPDTLKQHLRNAKRKLGMRSTIDLVLYVVRVNGGLLQVTNSTAATAVN